MLNYIKTPSPTQSGDQAIASHQRFTQRTQKVHTTNIKEAVSKKAVKINNRNILCHYNNNTCGKKLLLAGWYTHMREHLKKDNLWY